MKIKVLGTAAATSMPLAFCNCEVCKKARINGGKDIGKRTYIVINNIHEIMENKANLAGYHIAYDAVSIS